MLITPVMVVLVGFVVAMAMIAATYMVQCGLARFGRRRADIG
ncbi:MAG: hypothetical protein RIC52_17905 [Amphiplicatus sp.]